MNTSEERVRAIVAACGGSVRVQWKDRSSGSARAAHQAQSYCDGRATASRSGRCACDTKRISRQASRHSRWSYRWTRSAVSPKDVCTSFRPCRQPQNCARRARELCSAHKKPLTRGLANRRGHVVRARGHTMAWYSVWCESSTVCTLHALDFSSLRFYNAGLFLLLTYFYLLTRRGRCPLPNRTTSTL